MELLIGILCGIALSLFFSFGPAFFALIQSSVQYGYRRAVPFAFGVSVGDVVIVLLMLTVLKNVDMYAVMHNVWVASIAGVVIAMMGIYTFRKKSNLNNDKQSPDKFKIDPYSRRRTIFVRGFVLNFINPMIWIYWVSVIALFSGELHIPTNQMYLFFFGVLGATLGMDMLKCKLSSLLQRVITAKVMDIFNKVTGGLLVFFAGFMIVSMLLYNFGSEEKQHALDQPPTSTEVIKKMHELPIPDLTDTNHAHRDSLRAARRAHRKKVKEI